MSMSAATRQAFQTLHNVQPQKLESTLKRAVNNDAAAWSELQQTTGISDAGQIAQAIDAFRNNSFEGLLGANYQAATQTVTGANSAPTFSPAQGGIPASRMDQMLSMRAGGGSLSRLGTDLTSLNGEKSTMEGELKGLETQKTTAETKLEGLTLNRRERWFGGALAGVLGGDKDKAKLGKSLRKEIEATDTAITEKKGEIRSKTSEMKETVVSHLRSSSDPQFKTIDAQYVKTKTALSAANSMLGTINKAQSAVDSALWQERSEANSEHYQRHNNTSNNTTGGFGNSNYFGDSANQEATTALRRVNSALNSFSTAMQDYGRGVNITGLSTTSTGNEFDQITDMLGGNTSGGLGNVLGGIGSSMVINNLNNAESELSALEASVEAVKNRISSDFDVAVSTRNGFIDDVQARALGSVQ